MEKIEKLKQLLILTQNDTLTPKEVEKFLTMVLEVIKKSKDNFEKLSADNLQTLASSIAYVEELTGNVSNDLSSKSSALLGQIESKIDLLNTTLKEVKAMKLIPGKKGKDADEKKIIKKVLSQIELPKFKETILDDASQIKDKLETLEGDNRLDIKAIKGAEKLSTQANLDRAISVLDQRTQFLINKTNTGGGGGTWGSITGTLSDQTDLQGALDAKQDTLVSGTNIKTINSTSLLGSGDIVIDATVTLADLSANSTTTGTSLYTMTSGVNVDFQTSDATSLLKLNEATKTVTAPNYTWSNGTAGSVLFLGASGELAQDNTNFFWDDANNRLGVGTATPSAKLEVAGTDEVLKLTGTNPWISATSSSAKISMGIWGLADIGTIGTNNNYPMRLATNATTALYIDTSQNVGIGTASPVSKLQINNGTGISQFGAGSSGADIILSSGSAVYTSAIWSSIFGPRGSGQAFSWSDWDGNPLMTLITATGATKGNLGIGTTSPSAKLHTKATSASDIVGIFQGTTSQTGNLTEWRDVGGTAVARITSNGRGIFHDIEVGVAGINIAAVGGNGLNVSGGGFIIFKSSGVLMLSNSSVNDWDRLQFGGTTSSFPAIKRNGAGIDIRLADDSAYADITAKKVISTDIVRLKGYTVATLPTGTQGDTAFVTDALAPTFGATVVGSGAVVTKVFFDGTNWIVG